jgi:3-deoxy-7-phosphoheptulonate synthase
MNLNPLLTPINNGLNDTNIYEIKPLISPDCLLDELPITPKALDNVLLYREIIKNILSKEDHRLLVVVGPCSIHDTKAALEYAVKLKKLSIELQDSIVIVMRTYFEKPRTTIGWKGLINDPDLNDSYNINKGLKIARKLLIDINEIGLPTAIEFLDTISPQYISDLISWGAIGARTTESQLHRELVSGLSMPIGFKNSTTGNIKIIIDAIKSSAFSHKFLGINSNGISSIIKTRGNPHTHAILRGADHGPNYHKEFISTFSKILIEHKISTNIMIDCSHGNSNKSYKEQIKVVEYLIQLINSGNNDIMGLMIESNIKAGNQKLTNNLQYGVSITDECIDWSTTVVLLKKLKFAVQNNNGKKYNSIWWDNDLNIT